MDPAEGSFPMPTELSLVYVTHLVYGQREHLKPLFGNIAYYSLLTLNCPN